MLASHCVTEGNGMALPLPNIQSQRAIVSLVVFFGAADSTMFLLLEFLLAGPFPLHNRGAQALVFGFRPSGGPTHAYPLRAFRLWTTTGL